MVVPQGCMVISEDYKLGVLQRVTRMMVLTLSTISTICKARQNHVRILSTCLDECSSNITQKLYTVQVSLLGILSYLHTHSLCHWCTLAVVYAVEQMHCLLSPLWQDLTNLQSLLPEAQGTHTHSISIIWVSFKSHATLIWIYVDIPPLSPGLMERS